MEEVLEVEVNVAESACWLPLGLGGIGQEGARECSGMAVVFGASEGFQLSELETRKTST